jgi:hypothetical protein
MLGQQLHQAGDFLGRAPPVVRRESEQRQHADAQSGAASTVRRKAAAPARCPARRGNPRARAQRPLPSMMMAACSRPDPL